jgi:hypothetical protein
VAHRVISLQSSASVAIVAWRTLAGRPPGRFVGSRPNIKSPTTIGRSSATRCEVGRGQGNGLGWPSVKPGRTARLSYAQLAVLDEVHAMEGGKRRFPPSSERP